MNDGRPFSERINLPNVIPAKKKKKMLLKMNDNYVQTAITKIRSFRRSTV